MKLFLLLSLLGAAQASGGITYSSYSTAYGPLARNALAYGSFAHVPALATGYAAEGVVAAAPVATYAAAAPAVATYAAHVPAVAAYAAAPAAAVVPVTKVSAQPAVVQNLVDVAHPKVATRRYEIRRPAIQKQFYDVEERVVVRPAGSAVVELETPLGAKQRGPTQISPAAPPVALHSYASAHLQHAFAPALLPATPIGVTAFPHYPEVVEANQEIHHIPQRPESFQETPQQIPQQPISQPSFPQQDVPQQQFDDTDSVSVDNPEISARISRPPAPSPQRLPSTLFRSQLPDFPRAQSPISQFPREPLPDQYRSEGLPSFSRSRITEYLQPEPIPQQARSQLPLAPRNQPAPRPDFRAPQEQELPFQRNAPIRQQGPDFSFLRNIAPQQQELDLSYINSQQPRFNSPHSVSSRRGPNPESPFGAELESRSFGNEDVVPSARNLTPEQSRANQARLIDLLTSRGPVSEIRSASEPLRGPGPEIRTPSDQVRGRVISATPAPLGAEPADERVNTRRIVVNRPIQTVQEVDVVEPFTKLERVAVHQPAVVKTAHLEYAAVPAVQASIPAVHAVHSAAPSGVTLAPHFYK